MAKVRGLLIRSVVLDASALTLASLNVRVIDAPLGQAAGERIGRTQSRDNVTLDALVAEVASSLPRPVALLTADVANLQALVDPGVMVLDIAA